jgi:hypothetical protein
MDLTVFNDMDAAELQEYLQFLLWHYRVMDSFWYLNIAQHFDEAIADRLIPSCHLTSNIKKWKICH